MCITHNMLVCTTKNELLIFRSHNIARKEPCQNERKPYRDFADKWKFIDTRVQLTWTSTAFSNAITWTTKLKCLTCHNTRRTTRTPCVQHNTYLYIFPNHPVFTWKITQSIQFNRDNMETFSRKLRKSRLFCRAKISRQHFQQDKRFFPLSFVDSAKQKPQLKMPFRSSNANQLDCDVNQHNTVFVKLKDRKSEKQTSKVRTSLEWWREHWNDTSHSFRQSAHDLAHLTLQVQLSFLWARLALCASKWKC